VLYCEPKQLRLYYKLILGPDDPHKSIMWEESTFCTMSYLDQPSKFLRNIGMHVSQAYTKGFQSLWLWKNVSTAKEGDL